MLLEPKTATDVGKAFLAAQKGDAQAVTAWLDEGGGVNTSSAEHRGASLLMAAADAGQETVARVLLKRGASVNLQDAVGSTALMLAAIGGHAPIVRVLLEHGASVNHQNAAGGTALIGIALSTADKGYITIMQALLDAKADVLPQTPDGCTALTYAESRHLTAPAKLLRQHTERQ